MARESIANIISRVEADFGPGALDPLVNLIEQFNSDLTIETTHTIASHRINAPAFLHTAIIVGPRGNLWLEPSELESNSQECVRALSAFAARQLTLDTTIRSSAQSSSFGTQAGPQKSHTGWSSACML